MYVCKPVILSQMLHTTTLPVKITYLEKLEHPHENASMKTGACFMIIQARAELHRPGQTTKSAKKLANLVVWPGLCSSALAWTMTKYAHLGVD